MRVDVADAFGLHSSPLEGRAHHQRDAGRGRLRRGHVVRVVRRPVPEHLGVDRRPAGARRLELLEHDRSSALADDEAGARGVEGPGRAGRVLLLGGEALIAQNPARIGGVHAGLGAAREHRVGVAAPDQLRALADGV